MVLKDFLIWACHGVAFGIGAGLAMFATLWEILS